MTDPRPTDAAGDLAAPHASTTPEAMHADWLLPLRRARARRGRTWLVLQPDATLASYWEPVRSRTGGVAELAPDALDGAAALRALAAHWLAEGELELAALEAPLEALRVALAAKEADGDGARAGEAARPALSYSAYPLF